MKQWFRIVGLLSLFSIVILSMIRKDKQWGGPSYPNNNNNGNPGYGNNYYNNYGNNNGYPSSQNNQPGNYQYNNSPPGQNPIKCSIETDCPNCGYNVRQCHMKTCFCCQGKTCYCQKYKK